MASPDGAGGRCAATAKSGKPCGAQAWRGDLCIWHHPDAAEERRQNARKGGRSRADAARARKQLPADPMTDEEVLAWLGVLFKRVLVGNTAPGVGNACATIARAMVAVKQAGDLEERLAALEERAGLAS